MCVQLLVDNVTLIVCILHLVCKTSPKHTIVLQCMNPIRQHADFYIHYEVMARINRSVGLMCNYCSSLIN